MDPFHRLLQQPHLHVHTAPAAADGFRKLLPVARSILSLALSDVGISTADGWRLSFPKAGGGLTPILA